MNVQGRFPVIKITVIKVIKDFRLFKISPKLSLNAASSRTTIGSVNFNQFPHLRNLS